MSIDYPASLKAVGGARTGIAPVNLLDVQDVNGNLYYWADRRCNAPVAISGEIEVNAAPPVEPGAGQYVTWAFAGTATPTIGNAAAGSVTNLTDQTATIEQTLSAPLGNTNEKVVWSNYQMPALPPGAVIDAMYPVAVMTGEGTDALNISSFAIPGNGEFDAQYNNGSIGTTLAELQALSLYVEMAASVPGEGAFFQQIIVSFIGVAIYYHLRTLAGSGSRRGS